MKYEKEFREDHPETVGEKDKNYDRSNYIDWIDAKYYQAKLKSMASSSSVSNLFKPCTSCKYLRKIVADGVTVDMWGCDKSGMYLTNPDKFSCQSHTNDC